MIPVSPVRREPRGLFSVARIWLNYTIELLCGRNLCIWPNFGKPKRLFMFQSNRIDIPEIERVISLDVHLIPLSKRFRGKVECHLERVACWIRLRWRVAPLTSSMNDGLVLGPWLRPLLSDDIWSIPWAAANRPLASTSWEIWTAVPTRFHWPRKSPFIQRLGFNNGIISCGFFSSFARRDITCPLGKKRLSQASEKYCTVWNLHRAYRYRWYVTRWLIWLALHKNIRKDHPLFKMLTNIHLMVLAQCGASKRMFES